MGGSDSHRGEKRASLCSASVCFLGVFCALEKVGLPPEKKLLAGRLVLDPLPVLLDEGINSGLKSIVEMGQVQLLAEACTVNSFIEWEIK